MDTQNHTVAITHVVSDVAIIINLPHVQTRAQIRQKCALCSGDHPASYKGCSVYRDLQRGRKQTTKSNFLSDNVRNKTTNVRGTHPLTNAHPNQPSNHSPTYAQATSGQSDINIPPIPTQDLSNTITNFLEEFKSLINPLISLLNKVITKLLDKI